MKLKKIISSLDNIPDVDIDNATAFDILQFINGKWRNQQNLTMLGGGDIYLKKDSKIYFDA